jgi:hypothetical protein
MGKHDTLKQKAHIIPCNVTSGCHANRANTMQGQERKRRPKKGYTPLLLPLLFPPVKQNGVLAQGIDQLGIRY